jgi:hypothetical protein
MEDIDITKARNSRILRTVLLLITVFFLSLPAKAQYGGGSGEPNDPYQIATAEDLMLLGESTEDYDKHFILTADIDLSSFSGTDFNIIGISEWDAFAGVFDGGGHVISNFTYDSNDTDHVGLFGFVRGKNALIKDLGLIDPNIDARNSYGVAPLVSWVKDGAAIRNCYVEEGNVAGKTIVGGLVAGNENAYVMNCYAAGTVSGSGPESWPSGISNLVGVNHGTISDCSSAGNVTGIKHVGGLVGINRYYGTITNSYSSSMVTGANYVGGLIGHNENVVIQCYAMGSVTGERIVGGLIGVNRGRITNCYSTGSVSGNEDVGGLAGANYGTVRNSFWDIETSGQARSEGGMGKTTSEMHTMSTFTDAGWDFIDEMENGTEDIWKISEGLDYPHLWWERTTGDMLVLVVDDFESYNDLKHDDPNSNRIYLVWIDGWYDQTNGAIVGFVEPPWVERTIAHSGVQSMSFAYDNSAGYSEATANIANLAIGRDWTTEDVSVLSLWFGDVWGAASNDPEPMYVALANADGSTAAVYYDNPNATQVDSWTEWRIYLQRFANQGVDITNIDTISIGFGDKNNPQAGGSGVMYFDDIQVIPTSSSLVSHWKFDEGTGSTASDSWGSSDGAITGASWVNGLIGGALDFDGSGDYVNVGNDDSLEIDITNSNVTISAWVYPKTLDNYEPVFVVDDYDGAYYGYMLMITPNGKVWLTYGDGTGVDSNNIRTKTGTTSLQTNMWYHVVGVIRGATDMSIFINGLDDGGEYSGNGGEVSYSSASASIGRVRFGTLDNEFNGSLDDVMVFDRALTEGEVRLLPVLLKRGIPLP